MFRVARGRATVLCLKTRGAAPGGISAPRAWTSSLLPTPPRPQGGAEGQNPASKAEEEEEDPWGAWAPRTWVVETSTLPTPSQAASSAQFYKFNNP